MSIILRVVPKKAYKGKRDIDTKGAVSTLGGMKKVAGLGISFAF